MKKVLVDTDIGGDIDDALTLAYLLREPECQLLGITTVCGESEKRASIADALCKAAGKTVPIVAGLDTTLQPVPVYPTPAGQAALKDWPHDVYSKGDAVAFLRQMIEAHPHEIYLLGIGNMTNIASLFQTYPETVGLLAGFYVMNGYFGQESLPDSTWNWNSWADPRASQISFQARVKEFKVFPLEVTETLSIPAAAAETWLPANDDLMRAVYAFGGAWLTSSRLLTLHDPLAAVSLFYPNLCRYVQGSVSVERHNPQQMGATTLTEQPDGNLAVATDVEKEIFYQILAGTLVGEPLPKNVVNRGLASGTGRQWLRDLPATIQRLSQKWGLTEHTLLTGGSASYVAAVVYRQKPAVLKINLPSESGNGPLLQSVKLLERANGQGYPRLYAYDLVAGGLLLEKLGPPLSQLGESTTSQIKRLCRALAATWAIPVQPDEFTRDDEQVWFTDFIKTSYQQLGRPCSPAMYDLALAFLKKRRKAPVAEFVLLHGDAHSGNLLQDPHNPTQFKLIDADGLYNEKAYDLGVLMREWLDDYFPDPKKAAQDRCHLLAQLTGVDAGGIWEWGYLQLLGTAFVLLQMGQKDQGQKMLAVASYWL